MNRACTLAAALLACAAVACEPSGPYTERWELSDGSAIELDLGGPSEHEARDGKALYRLAGGVVVTVQELDRDARLPAGDRTPLSVARALVERVELGEREGELATHRCRVGQQHAECVTGWTVRGDRRFARHGAVFEIGARIVWLDVAGPIEVQADVARRATELRAGARLEPAGPVVARAAMNRERAAGHAP